MKALNNQLKNDTCFIDIQTLTHSEMMEIEGGWTLFASTGWSFGTGFKIGLGVGLAAGAGYAVMNT